jgi:hypothetical protein
MSWPQWVTAALAVPLTMGFGALLGFGVLLLLRWNVRLSARRARRRRRSRPVRRAVGAWRAGGTVHRGW